MSNDFPPHVNVEFRVFKHLRDDPVKRPWYFVSLRWRVLLPLTLLVMALAAVGAYVLGDAAARHVQEREIDRLLVTSQGIMVRMQLTSTDQQQEAARLAYTVGVAERIAAEDSAGLHTLLEPLARAASDVDYVLAVGESGRELVGLQRVIGQAGEVDYAVATGTDLSVFPADLLDPPAEGSWAVLRTGQGYALFTSVAVEPAGALLIGQRIERVLAELRGGEAVDLVIFGADQTFIHTTLPFNDETRTALAIAPVTYEQALTTPGQVPVTNLMLQNEAYNVAYLPWVIDGTPLGVLAVYRPDETPLATWLSRELLAGMAAALVAAVMLSTFVVMGRIARQVEHVQQTAHALAVGDAGARTGSRIRDEIGELGATLDRLAEHQQRRTDNLHAALRQQRVETARLSAILESIPDGLVVQDLEGRVLLINEAARELVGGQRIFRAARLHELTTIIHDKLGAALAPGIYALGDPTRLSLDGRLLQAQAAALTIQPHQQRIGTVIVLRDITTDVLREQRREELIDRLSEQALAPRAPAAYESLSTLARAVAQNTRAIQQVIAELRDLSTFEPHDLASDQQSIPVNRLLNELDAEWGPQAETAQLRMNVLFGPPDKFILGDERRLRWAIGNVLDNAIKFSPPRTSITLAGRYNDAYETNLMEIIIKDQGYGVASEDIPHVFTRFYRGEPRDYEGQKLRKPGTGQGLFIAKRVIEAHGGHIELASRIGVGTTVLIQLPLTAEQPLTAGVTGSDVDHDGSPTVGSDCDTVPIKFPRTPE